MKHSQYQFSFQILDQETGYHRIMTLKMMNLFPKTLIMEAFERQLLMKPNYEMDGLFCAE